LTEFVDEVRSTFKGEVTKQVQNRAKEEQTKDIETTAVAANENDGDKDVANEDLEEEDGGSGSKEKGPVSLDFQRSEVPGEAFVAAAKQNPISKETALAHFKELNLMLPKPVRK